jgi:hypothetical protein
VTGVVLVGTVVLSLAYRAYYLHSAEQRLQAAIAATEAHDPIWRWEELLAQREVIPDDQNSSPHIVAAARLLPPAWPAKPAGSEPERPTESLFFRFDPLKSEGALSERLQRLPSVELPDDQLAQDLRGELTVLASALERARPIIDLPRGRHPVEWKRDFISTSLPGIEATRRIARLFRLDATRKIYEAKSDEALASFRGILNTARSIGDEPVVLCPMVRGELERMACQSLVHILAQGTPPKAALLKVQEMLTEELRDLEPLALFALKGERAGMFNALGLIAVGEMTLDEFNIGRPKPQSWLKTAWEWLVVQPRMRMGQAAYLERMTRVADIARLPVGTQPREFAEFEDEVVEYKRAFPHLGFALSMIPKFGMVLSKHYMACANLDCARTAVAAERYRLAHGEWPQSLDQLVPDFLDAIPQDIFGAGPLRVQRLKDGLLIYSVGPNNEQPIGSTDEEIAGFKPTVGFRLWDVDQRGKRASTGKTDDTR